MKNEKRTSEDGMHLWVDWEPVLVDWEPDKTDKIPQGLDKGTYFKTYYERKVFGGWRTKEAILSQYPTRGGRKQ